MQHAGSVIHTVSVRKLILFVQSAFVLQRQDNPVYQLPQQTTRSINSMSFDASALIQSVTDQPMAEQRILVPEGEYAAVSQEVKPENFKIITSEKFKPSENGCDKAGRRLVLDLSWQIDDAGVATATHKSKNFVRQSLFIDVTPDSDLEAGRFSLAGGDEWNLQLGRLRKIFGQNEAGKPWSFSMLAGKAARVTVEHTKQGEAEYDGVKKVVTL
jgi:hypothetical protein